MFSFSTDKTKCRSFLHDNDKDNAKAMAKPPGFSENCRAKTTGNHQVLCFTLFHRKAAFFNPRVLPSSFLNPSPNDKNFA